VAGLELATFTSEMKRSEMKRLVMLGIVGFLTGPAAWAQSGSVRETALARIPRAWAVAADPQIVKAVVAQNTKAQSMDEVRRIDQEWAANPQLALRKALSSSACAQRLRDLTKDDPVVVEVILMDARGANVCVSRETTDYWQGDEAKFQKTFGAGKELFMDEPALDASTETYAIQLSVLVSDGQSKVGALTLSLRVPKKPATTGGDGK
jgi:hypothetical protein